MRGAVAAGHPLTAAAGESMLTGPGGGGFMLVHDASDGKTRLLDFFVAVPERVEGPDELLELAVDFDGDTQQVFHTGAAAVAVPGTALGLETAHRSFGTL